MHIGCMYSMGSMILVPCYGGMTERKKGGRSAHGAVQDLSL